jgi:CheY-like chemotaxis protein
MMPSPVILLLADDDKDDCIFFQEALGELPLAASLTTVHDGEQLMELLEDRKQEPPPAHVLFLDLNMPRKNGFECLEEIMSDEKLKDLPVIIFSTSFEQDVVNLLYKKGATHYIRKPADFSELKRVIHQALILATQDNFVQPPKEDFVIKPNAETVPQ